MCESCNADILFFFFFLAVCDFFPSSSTVSDLIKPKKMVFLFPLLTTVSVLLVSKTTEVEHPMQNFC